MLPARFVAESLGASVVWESKEPNKILIQKNLTEILFYIGSSIAYINDREVILDSAPFIEKERTYTPVRFICESLGADVEWNDKTAEATITPQDAVITEEKATLASGKTFQYLLYRPANASEGLPLIVYLHGGSGKGNDLGILTQNDGFPQYLKDGKLKDIPAYILIPQLSAPYTGWGSARSTVVELIRFVCDAYSMDTRRISLTGHSMGGTGVWNVASACPDMFSCIAPLSGSIQTKPETLSAFSSMPIYTVVGSADTIVPPDSSVEFISALQSDRAQIFVLEGATHFDVPSLAYLSNDFSLLRWLLSQSK